MDQAISFGQFAKGKRYERLQNMVQERPRMVNQWAVPQATSLRLGAKVSLCPLSGTPLSPA